MDINLNCKSVSASANGTRISVDIEGVTGDDLLQHCDTRDAVSTFGEANLLNQIGINYVKEYFGLTEIE